MAKRRRILEKLMINEISGVDRPCHEGARVAIMKRAESDDRQTETDMDVEGLEGRANDLEAQIAHLTKALAAVGQRNRLSAEDFEQAVAEIRKRDNCSRTDALAKARKEAPEAFATYCDGSTNADFNALVAEEIAKGCPPAVAAQRVSLRYPDAAATVITKQDKHPFEKVVDAIMEQDGVTRSVAMARARKKEPVKFAAYQEA
jgi:hypothetical protein